MSDEHISDILSLDAVIARRAAEAVDGWVRRWFEQNMPANVRFCEREELDRVYGQILLDDRKGEMVQLATPKRSSDVDGPKASVSELLKAQLLEQCKEVKHNFDADPDEKWLSCWPQAFVQREAYLLHSFLWCDCVQGHVEQ